MPPDPLPDLVDAFAAGRSDGRELLDHFLRHVARVASPYPGAYFPLGRKDDDAVDELAHRVFTSGARTPKGRFPFLGRTPLGAFVAERFDGRSIRYHSFYARLSITREMLRDEYARNVVRDPVLRQRAEVWAAIGACLEAAPEERRGEMPRAWLLGALAREPDADLPRLAARAVELAGALPRAELTDVVLEVLGPPPVDTPPADADPDPAMQGAVRAAVRAAWLALDADGRALLRGLAGGLSYAEIIVANPQFKHKVAVTRAVERCTQGFVARVVAAVGGTADGAAPAELAERIFEVLVEVDPSLLEES